MNHRNKRRKLDELKKNMNCQIKKDIFSGHADL